MSELRHEGDVISVTLQHLGSKPKELREKVMAFEAEAARQLGGPVQRSHQFINGGQDCTWRWTRVED